MEKTKKERKRSPFSINEDQKLISLVEKYGENLSAWKCIASNMEGRNARQCRERYKLFLSDEFKKKPNGQKKKITFFYQNMLYMAHNGRGWKAILREELLIASETDIHVYKDIFKKKNIGQKKGNQMKL